MYPRTRGRLMGKTWAAELPVRVAWLLIALALIGPSGTAQGPPSARPVKPAPPQEPVALIHANVVDVRTGTIARDTTVVLRDGRIASIGQTAAPSGIRTVDLRGKYLVPGLIDAHTHLQDFASARLALDSGVTTVRVSGVPHYADVGLRELVRKGELAGPDVLASGYHVRPRLAEEAFLNDPAQSPLLAGVTSIDRLQQAVRMNLAHGADWIKVMATERAGTVDTDPRMQVYTEEELRAVVDEAATKNAPVQAHAHGDEGALAAVRAGVRSIEHGTYLSEATLSLMKEKGTWLVPTYIVVGDLATTAGDYDVPALQIRARHMQPRLAETIRRARALGVKVGAGTDTRYAWGSLGRIAEELEQYVSLGFTPLQALQAATIVNADLLRLDKSIGAIAVGYEADLLAVDGDPLVDILTLHDPLLVISNGRIAVNRLEFARPGRFSTALK